MLIWTLVCLLGTIVTGFLAYRKEKSTVSQIAKLLFFIFLFCFLSLLIMSALSSAPPPLREPPPMD